MEQLPQGSVRLFDNSKVHLSNREIEVCKSIKTYDTIKQMAEALNISEKTVKFHLTHIFSKTGRPNRISLLKYVYENGI